MSGVSASPLSISFNTLTSTTPTSRTITPPTTFSFCSHSNLKTNLNLQYRPVSTVLCRPGVRCRVRSGSGGPTSGENESKNVLDAFFLGKALAEALNERVESAVGEFLGTVSRLQAEQQRQIQDFQTEVLERAKKAKEQAARETTEAQGIVGEGSTVSGRTSSVSGDGVSVTSPSTVSAADASNSLPYSIATETNSDPADKGPL